MSLVVPVVLCGGSGSRMWPLSRTLRPKQLLPLTGERSLFQDTLTRLQGLEVDAPLVVCAADVRFSIAEQLAELGVEAATIVAEPVGRNTAPAVAMAAMLAAEAERDAMILVLPSDHHIHDPEAFRRALAAGRPLAEEGWLVSFGVPPAGPSRDVGWILPGPPLGPGHVVADFTEKPDEATAQRWFEEGSRWWNSGVLLARADRVLAELERFAPRMMASCRAAHAELVQSHGFHHLGEAFHAVPADSLDYAVLERTDRAAVVRMDAGWQDVGSWHALWEISTRDDAGNVVLGDAQLVDTADCYVRAGHRLVVTVGLREVVVIETADAVLVAPKDRVHEVGEAVAGLRARGRPEVDRHRVVERPWGTYEVLAVDESTQVKRITVKPGGGLSLQYHEGRAECWVVLRGEARVTVGDETRTVCRGGLVQIERGVSHRLENLAITTVELVEVQFGDIREEDIVRLADRYGRTPS